MIRARYNPVRICRDGTNCDKECSDYDVPVEEEDDAPWVAS
jgi:hypothetical protein